MASETRNLLGVGLVTKPIDPEGTMIPNEIAKAKSSNCNLDVYEIDASVGHDEIISGLTQYLKSKKYAAITIGFGVRGNSDLTPLFEKLVNACVEHQPGAKYGFALHPTLMVESFERVLH